MTRHVWVCKTPMDPTALRGFWPIDLDDNGRGERANAYSDIANRSGRFDHVEPAELASCLFALKRAKAHLKAKRHMFSNGHIIISEESADVLRAHDMGQTTLVPVTLLHPDRETEVPGPWYYLQVRDAKEAVLPNVSTGLMPEIMRSDRFSMFTTIADDAIKLVPAALQGPDIWFDPQIYTAFFLSDRLANALKAAKVARHWGLGRCVVEG